MTNWPVFDGAVGVSRSCSGKYVLLQVTDMDRGRTQSRAVLTPSQAQQVIEDIQEELEILRKIRNEQSNTDFHA